MKNALETKMFKTQQSGSVSLLSAKSGLEVKYEFLIDVFVLRCGRDVLTILEAPIYGGIMLK